MTSPPFITAAALADSAGLRHGFFTRQGGVSSGIYDSLNCGPGSSDDAASVAENRRRVATAMGSALPLASLYQVHGKDVQVVAEDYDPSDRPKADGLVTKRRGVALGILTADCTPVLFADAAAGVIGACHAGWRGAMGGIAEATLEAMIAIGARRAHIRAAIGPTIRQPSYEVGEEFFAAFLEEDSDNAAFFAPGKRPGHCQFDLPGYLLRRLKRAGIETEDTGLDTLSEPERFFSYRRTTLAKESDYGRQVSAIALIDG